MRILLVGGGTLGPVTPLLAVREAILKARPDAVFLLAGTRNGPEKILAQAAGLDFVSLRAAKFERYLTPRLLLFPFVFCWSLLAAAFVILRFRSQIIFSAGAFVAVPFALTGRALGVPVVLHQPDIRPGLSNRIMARYATAITVAVPELTSSFPKTKTIITGIPVRTAVARVLEDRTELAAAGERRFDLDPTVPTVFVIGGGTGALQLNNLVNDSAEELVEEANVIHVSGLGKGGAGISDRRYKLRPFLNVDELAEALASADLVVSRAGMGAIAELAAVEMPFVLLPMPDSPQEENAAYFAAKAGVPVLGKKVTTNEFKKKILEILRDKKSWSGSLEKLRLVLPPRAAERVAQVVLQAADRKGQRLARPENR